MKLIVGLGNPGRKFKGTRHNLGIMVVDRMTGGQEWKESRRGKLLYTWIELGGEKAELMKSMTFMNESGYAVSYALKKHPRLRLEDLFVIHDDLDIPLGRYKIQLGKGPHQHKGLESIYEQLGSKEFWHVRVGIENRSVSGGKMISGEEYVLQRFTQEEREIVDRVVQEVVEELLRRLSVE